MKAAGAGSLTPDLAASPQAAAGPCPPLTALPYTHHPCPARCSLLAPHPAPSRLLHPPEPLSRLLLLVRAAPASPTAAAILRVAAGPGRPPLNPAPPRA